jgi:hypothetical protein
MSDEHFYCWVRVGDGEPEPAAVEGEKPNRKATTIGCPDPFMIDEPECPCQLLYESGDGLVEEAEITADVGLVSYKEAQAQERRWRKHIAKYSHSYAGFGRRS